MTAISPGGVEQINKQQPQECGFIVHAGVSTCANPKPCALHEKFKEEIKDAIELAEWKAKTMIPDNSAPLMTHDITAKGCNGLATCSVHLEKPKCKHEAITAHGECGQCGFQTGALAIGHERDKSCCEKPKDFSDFMLNASAEEKKKVFGEAAQRANEEQFKLVYDAKEHRMKNVKQPKWELEFDERFGNCWFKRKDSLKPTYDFIEKSIDIKSFIRSLLESETKRAVDEHDAKWHPINEKFIMENKHFISKEELREKIEGMIEVVPEAKEYWEKIDYFNQTLIEGRNQALQDLLNELK